MQKHHFFTNKHSIFTDRFNNIFSKYGMSLDDSWNIGNMPHLGRHTTAYHEYMWENLQLYDAAASGDKAIFIEKVNTLIQSIINDPSIMYR
jgi:hypothetical protein